MFTAGKWARSSTRSFPLMAFFHAKERQSENIGGLLADVYSTYTVTTRSKPTGAPCILGEKKV